MHQRPPACVLMICAILPCRCPKDPPCLEACGRLVELWDRDLVRELSMHPRVARVIALGA